MKGWYDRVRFGQLVLRKDYSRRLSVLVILSAQESRETIFGGREDELAAAQAALVGGY